MAGTHTPQAPSPTLLITSREQTEVCVRASERRVPEKAIMDGVGDLDVSDASLPSLCKNRLRCTRQALPQHRVCSRHRLRVTCLSTRRLRSGLRVIILHGDGGRSRWRQSSKSSRRNSGNSSRAVGISITCPARPVRESMNTHAAPPSDKPWASLRPLSTALAGLVADHASWHLPELAPICQAPACTHTISAQHQGKYTPPVVVWLRQEMRLADNPALSAAAATGAPVIPVWILAPDEEQGGGRSRARQGTGCTTRSTSSSTRWRRSARGSCCETAPRTAAGAASSSC